jgi:hypothetical protein
LRVQLFRRNKKGKIKRSSAAKHDFMKQTGFLKGRKGYLVDYNIEFAAKPYR